MSKTKPVEILMFGWSDCGQDEILMKSIDKTDKTTKKSNLYTNKKAMVWRHFNSRGGLHCTVNTYDVLEQEKFKKKGSATYEKASAIILIFDIAKKDSWDLITGWNIHKEKKKDLPLWILANKLDGKQEVKINDVAAWCKDNGAEYMEIATKKGTNVDLAIKKVSDSAVAYLFKEEASLGYNVKDEEKPKNISGEKIDIKNIASGQDERQPCCNIF